MLRSFKIGVDNIAGSRMRSLVALLWSGILKISSVCGFALGCLLLIKN